MKRVSLGTDYPAIDGNPGTLDQAWKFDILDDNSCCFQSGPASPEKIFNGIVESGFRKQAGNCQSYLL